MQVNNRIPAHYKPLPPIPQRAAVTQAPPTPQPTKATRSLNMQQVVAKSANALQEVRNLTSPTQIKDIGIRCATLTVAHIQDNARMLSSWFKSSSLNTLSSPGRNGHQLSAQTSNPPQSQTQTSNPPQSQAQISNPPQGQTQISNPPQQVPSQTSNPESRPPVTQDSPTQQELLDAKADIRHAIGNVNYIKSQLQESRRNYGQSSPEVARDSKRLEQANGKLAANQAKYDQLQERMLPEELSVRTATTQEDRDKAVTLYNRMPIYRQEIREVQGSLRAAQRDVNKLQNQVQELVARGVKTNDPSFLSVKDELSKAYAVRDVYDKELDMAKAKLNEKLGEKAKMGRELINHDPGITVDSLIKDLNLVIDQHLSPGDKTSKLTQQKFAMSLIEDLGFDPLKFAEMHKTNPDHAKQALKQALRQA